RLAKAAFERFCDQRRKTGRVSTRSHVKLVGADKFLPIFLDRHCFTHTYQLICHLITGVGDRGSFRGLQYFSKPSQAARPPAVDASNPPTPARAADVGPT